MTEQATHPSTERARAGEGLAVVDELVPGAELVIRGRLDVMSVSPVREALHRAVDGGSGDLVVHLDDAHVLDAAGLGVLLGAHRRARMVDRRLVLTGVPGRLERLIRHTRLHRVLVRETSSVSA
jgi:anti-anti-sigma factor